MQRLKKDSSSLNLHIPLQAKLQFPRRHAVYPALQVWLSSAAPTHKTCFICTPPFVTDWSPHCLQLHKTHECFVTRPFAKVSCLTCLIAANARTGCPAGPVHRVRWVWRVVSDLLENNVPALSAVMWTCDARRIGCRTWLVIDESSAIGWVATRAGVCATEGSSVSSQSRPWTQFTMLKSHSETRDWVSRSDCGHFTTFFMRWCHFPFFSPQLFSLW